MQVRRRKKNNRDRIREQEESEFLMKNKKIFLIAAVFCILAAVCLTAVVLFANPDKASGTSAVTEMSASTSVQSESAADADSEPAFIEPNLIFASDLYEGYGYVHQRCGKTAKYSFAPINSEGIDWLVYILDKEFTDAERFIPQAYPLALTNSGELEIEEGQWIYIYCPCNSWTGTSAPEGCAFSWGFSDARIY